MSRRLYLDNAATSFPKAPGVAEAVHRYLTEVGATPGRATYAESREGGRIIRQCRERICRLINGEDPEHVVFTLNTTDALNVAIKGVVAHRRRANPDRHVHIVSSAMDHNSVLRPFNALARDGVSWTCVPADAEGFICAADVERAIGPDTALVALSHASNVTGSIQPVEAVGEICRQRGVLFLLDAAQSLGHMPVDARTTRADMLAFPGHKGLLGPLGTGGLYLRPGVEELVDTLREGGTGTASELDHQPAFMPDKYEPGSHNAVGIAGLSEAVGWLLDHAVPENFGHEGELVSAMLAELRARGVRHGPGEESDAPSGPLARMRLLGPAEAARRVGVFSLVHDTASPHEIAAVLESSFGILSRPGLHCAPRAHAAMGTLQERGALRLSVGPFVTAEDVQNTCEALAEIAASLAPAAIST